MKIDTTRFGQIEVADRDVFTFQEGLLGFADTRLYVLLKNPKGGGFEWLQAAELSSLAFVVCDPVLFFPDYRVRVRREDLETIRLADAALGVVRVILTVPGHSREITANLLGPLILNREERLGRQLVLVEAGLTTRHRIFGEAK